MLKDLTTCLKDALVGYKHLQHCIGKDDVVEKHLHEPTKHAKNDKACHESMFSCVNGALNVFGKEEFSSMMDNHDEECADDDHKSAKQAHLKMSHIIDGIESEVNFPFEFRHLLQMVKLHLSKKNAIKNGVN